MVSYGSRPIRRRQANHSVVRRSLSQAKPYAFVAKDVSAMAKCANCGKVPVVGRNVSYAKNRTPRLFRPNLQKTSVFDPKTGKQKQVTMCAKCIKTMGKVR
jgi:large subunit ribosomal protein L28